MKRTYQPKSLKRKRKFGFLKRSSTTNGMKIILRRIKKNRWKLAH